MPGAERDARRDSNGAFQAFVVTRNYSSLRAIAQCCQVADMTGFR
jgi:hypothetical protein